MFRMLREKLTLADVLLIFILILIICLSAGMTLKKRDDRMVYISKNNQVIGIYSLNKDKVIHIDEHNTVGIANSKVRMTYADCPDKRCVKQGAGDLLPIICLPNQVVVEIRSKGSERVLIVR
jgi:hypothetical protein